MSYQLTANDLELITEILEQHDVGTVMQYSGRAMYGDQCLGIVTEDEASTFLILGLELAGASYRSLGLTLSRSGMRTDSMGRDSVVVYFPSITMPEGFVEEDEDSD
jgi:hypothetical protein